MENHKRISCIILACDSHINKGISIFHCVWSVCNQNYKNIEIIIVENSHKKPKYLRKLEAKFNKWNNKTKSNSFKIINNKQSFSRGKARNIGISHATGELIVFLDDDTIILDSSAFTSIVKFSKYYDYGFGAKRLWTHDNLFQKKTKAILSELETNSARLLLFISRDPNLNDRKESQSTTTLAKTFIANFGFVKRNLLIKTGGFIDFPGCVYEDDHLMFKLFLLDKKYLLLNNLTVIHVNHPIKVKEERNVAYYFRELVKQGYYWFNIINIFEKKNEKLKILEPLKSIHFDYKIKQIIESFSEFLPINLSNVSAKEKIYWQKNNLPSDIQIVRLIKELCNSKNLDSFIKSSSIDFDNVAELIRLCIESGIIKITKNTKIIPCYHFKYTQPSCAKEYKKPVFIPNEKLNQFPCDEFSRTRRYEFIKERYPYTEYLKFGIIGDDDYTSLKFVNDFWAWPVTVEKDKRIISSIKNASDRFEILNIDVSKIEKVSKLPTIQTFITDPPYTLHGSLSFIYCGLVMLTKDSKLKEFYVILNPVMMGKNLYRLQRILINTGVYISEVINNFSQYDLPENYKENKRAKFFLHNTGISEDGLKRSSSSNLYIFTTYRPNLEIIRSSINYSKMYKHYDN